MTHLHKKYDPETGFNYPKELRPKDLYHNGKRQAPAKSDNFWVGFTVGFFLSTISFVAFVLVTAWMGVIGY